jgi:hypothetical protein
VVGERAGRLAVELFEGQHPAGSVLFDSDESCKEGSLVGSLVDWPVEEGQFVPLGLQQQDLGLRRRRTW